MGIFEERESEVRSYCRKWPAVFDRATGSWLYDESGRPYLDFFAGAGALNYGHSNPVLKEAVLEYLARDGVVHSLDMHTVAKAEAFEAVRHAAPACLRSGHRVRERGEASGMALKVAATAFDLGLLIETAGPKDQVVKLRPALTISDDELGHGLDMFTEAVRRMAG
jgi:diaminobutyrate-2-oxoglutarate transaminase